MLQSVARAAWLAIALGAGGLPSIAAQSAAPAPGKADPPAAATPPAPQPPLAPPLEVSPVASPEASPDPAGTSQSVPTNAKCPVMTDEDALADHAVHWQGRTIGFCCDKCIRKFQQRPDRYVANLPPLAAPATSVPAAPDDTGALPTTSPTPTGSTPPSSTSTTPPASDRGRLELLVGRVHPMLVHFPTALLLAAALAEMMGALRGSSGSSTSARFCVALGALGAVAAAITGWQRAQAFVPLPGTESHVDIHRWLAVATAGYALLLTLVGVWARERSTQVRSPGLGLFRWGLLLGAALVAVTAHYGGTLVFGADFPFGD